MNKISNALLLFLNLAGLFVLTIIVNMLFFAGIVYILFYFGFAEKSPETSEALSKVILYASIYFIVSARVILKSEQSRKVKIKIAGITYLILNTYMILNGMIPSFTFWILMSQSANFTLAFVFLGKLWWFILLPIIISVVTKKLLDRDEKKNIKNEN